MRICTYRIEDKNGINAACEVLQNLDLRHLLQKSVSGVGFDGSIQLPPLRVSLTDIIQCKRVTETETVVSRRIAQGVVVDSSGLLGSLPVLAISGFVEDDDPDEDINAIKGPSLINTKYAKRYDIFSNKLGKLRKKQRLVNEYKGVE